MARPKRLVFCVEGEADVKAVPVLVKRLLAEYEDPPWGHLFIDQAPMRVGNVNRLVGKHTSKWVRYLGAANKRSHLGGVLLLLDGDEKWVGKNPFCAFDVAVELAEASRQAGAGTKFSVVVVFARQEYESWLVAGSASLSGADQSIIIPENLDEAPRGADKLLKRIMGGSYKKIVDQEEFSRIIDLQSIRDRNLRSFQRLESALRQLVEAFRTDSPLISPTRTSTP